MRFSRGSKRAPLPESFRVSCKQFSATQVDERETRSPPKYKYIIKSEDPKWKNFDVPAAIVRGSVGF
jgi:hypothetical protein